MKHLVKISDDLSESQLGTMDEIEWASVASPLDTVTLSGNASFYLYEETSSQAQLFNDHLNISRSLTRVSSSATDNLFTLARSKSEWFPHGEEITKDYQIEEETYEDIGYIKNELRTSFPQISKDFRVFITKFNALKSDATQYQDLIGGRSLFFLKMIFDFSEQKHGVVKHRKIQIRTFVFGSATPINSVVPFIDVCLSLYRELSGQDTCGMSIKLGAVTAEYVEGLFRRLISSTATILRLKDQYYKP
jgi:hypothetical protein